MPRVGQCLLAVTAFASLTGVVLLLVGDLEQAIALATIASAAVSGASRIKQHHSGIKLTAADLALVRAGTLPFIVRQYRRTAIAAAACCTALCIAAGLAVNLLAGTPLPIMERLALLTASASLCALAYWGSGGAAAARKDVRQRHGYFATFAASVIDVGSWWPWRTLGLIDIVSGPALALIEPPRPLGGTRPVRPDIIIIQHESLFDPRLFGLVVEPDIAAFLSPPDGHSGTLNVDIYGGGSWQSEFSLITGLSSASFGRDAYFIQQKGVGRFRHTLPRALAALGYRTMLASSCRRRFLNYDVFYRSVGFEERVFSDDFPQPFDVERFEQTNSDAEFLTAAIAAFRSSIRADPAPRLLYALTNFNHGPHNRRLASTSRSEGERAFAMASLPDLQYAEYYARLAETAATWREQRSRLACSDRPLLVVHYGDHQPVMTRRIEHRLALSDDDRRQFRTFFAIESLNFALNPVVRTTGPVLDIAFLGTVAMQAACLPLDPISATRASLIAECGEAYFNTLCERKARFHRTLVDMHMIELGTEAQRSVIGVPESASRLGAA